VVAACRVSRKTRPMKCPMRGRQPGRHTTPAFTRERARRLPTPPLVRWTTSTSATRLAGPKAVHRHDLGRVRGADTTEPETSRCRNRLTGHSSPTFGRACVERVSRAWFVSWRQPYRPSSSTWTEPGSCDGAAVNAVLVRGRASRAVAALALAGHPDRPIAAASCTRATRACMRTRVRVGSRA
jgi:hypothetical protein